ncbi:MAG: hypothetical protein ACOX2O_08810 [Bdellovibrionota bacterium]
MALSSEAKNCSLCVGWEELLVPFLPRALQFRYAKAKVVIV